MLDQSVRGPFPFLRCETPLSVFDWEIKLGKELVGPLRDLEILEAVPTKDLIGRSVLLDLGEGTRTYEIEQSPEGFLAIPEAGGTAKKLEATETFLRSRTEKFYQTVAEANGFTVDSPQGLPGFVGAARREIEPGKVILLVMTLNDDWIGSLEGRLWMRAQRVTRIIIMKSGSSLTIQDGEQGSPLVACTFPLHEKKWKIDRRLYCSQELLLSAETVGKIYPEFKVIVDRKAGAMIILGKKIPVKTEVAWGAFMIGICEMGNSPISSEDFASTHLEFKVGDQHSKIRTSRADVEEKLREGFATTPELIDPAMHLFCPKPAIPKKVYRGFDASEVIFWPGDNLPE